MNKGVNSKPDPGSRQYFKETHLKAAELLNDLWLHFGNGYNTRVEHLIANLQTFVEDKDLQKIQDEDSKQQ